MSGIVFEWIQNGPKWDNMIHSISGRVSLEVIQKSSDFQKIGKSRRHSFKTNVFYIFLDSIIADLTCRFTVFDAIFNMFTSFISLAL